MIICTPRRLLGVISSSIDPSAALIGVFTAFFALAPAAVGQPPHKFAGFSAPVVYPVGGALSIEAGDLDGDGDIDFVTPNLNTGELSLLFNNGDGTFAPYVSLLVGGSVRSSAIADFNGDGIADLLVASASGPVFPPGAPQGGVLFLPGLGGGKFGDFSFYSAGPQPVGIDAGDLDGDGDIDFIVSNQLGGNVAVFHNNGDGTPGPPTFVPVGSVPGRVGLADMDGDGDLDAVVVNAFSKDLSVLINDGLGAFTPLPPVDTLFAFSLRLSIGDVDGDGLPDVIFPGVSLEKLLVHFNIGGSLGGPVLFDAGLVSTSAAVIDIDGDGAMDVILPGQLTYAAEDEFVRPMRGDGIGGFEINRLFPSKVGSFNAALSAIADLDNDGDMDLAIAHGFDVTVLLNLTKTPNIADLNHDGVVNSADLMTLLAAWGLPGAADFDKSGAIDASDLAHLLANWTQPAPVAPKTPSSSARGVSNETEPIVGSTLVHRRMMVDLNGDGLVDRVVGVGARSIDVHLNTGDPALPFDPLMPPVSFAVLPFGASVFAEKVLEAPRSGAPFGSDSAQSFIRNVEMLKLILSK